MQHLSRKKIATTALLFLSLLAFVAAFGVACKNSTASAPSAAETPPVSLPVETEVPAERSAEVSVFAGSLLPGHGDGANTQAQFVKPYGLCADGDDLLVVDSYNNLIRRISGGQVTTLTGVASVIDRTGFPLGGYLGGAAETAVLNKPRFAAVSTQGVVVFSDSGNHMVRVLDDGRVYLLAGMQEPGFRDGAFDQAQFNTPSGVAIGGNGIVYIADTLNHCIRSISADGIVATVAGNPQKPGFQDGSLGEALFCEPNDIALGADGALYVVDKGNQRIRKLYNGEVTTVAGSDTETDKTTGYIIGGYADGPGAQARFQHPTGLCISDNATIYVADTGNNCVRAISPDGVVVTVAGSKTAGNAGGAPLQARFSQPLDVALANGLLYISDSYNHAVRSVRVDEDTLFTTPE